jgi:hypothetical protein
MWRGTGSLMGSPEISEQTDQASSQIEGKIDSNGANNSTTPHTIKSLRKSVNSEWCPQNISSVSSNHRGKFKCHLADISQFGRISAPHSTAHWVDRKPIRSGLVSFRAASAFRDGSRSSARIRIHIWITGELRPSQMTLVQPFLAGSARFPLPRANLFGGKPFLWSEE